jgi:hypothetical protein
VMISARSSSSSSFTSGVHGNMLLHDLVLPREGVI